MCSTAKECWKYHRQNNIINSEFQNKIWTRELYFKFKDGCLDLGEYYEGILNKMRTRMTLSLNKESWNLFNLLWGKGTCKI